MSLKFLGDGVYRDSRTGNLYHRPIVGGRRTARKLAATSLKAARKQVAALQTRQAEARLGIGLDPYAPACPVGKLLDQYIKDGCPDRRRRLRTGESLASEKARLERLRPFWKNLDARTLGMEICGNYHAWRRRGHKQFRLDRSVDAELTTLSNALRWASWHGSRSGLKFNPLASRPRFDDSNLQRHCTAVMPRSDEELHQLAAYLLGTDQSRPLGWQLLLEALTGARTSEILKCRVDAREPGEAGFSDAHALHLARSKGGIEPWALLWATKDCSALAELLEAFHNWHRKSFPRSPWFIPGRTADKAARRTSLTRALARACRELEIPLVTSHGMRAYFVRTCRSLGIPDADIADRLGHRSVKLIEMTYGTVEPGFRGGRALDFMPEKFPPAWKKWLPRRRKILALPTIGLPKISRKNDSKPKQLEAPSRMKRT